VKLLPSFEYELNDLIDPKPIQRDNYSQFTYSEEVKWDSSWKSPYSDPGFNLDSVFNFQKESSKVIDLPEMDRTNDFRVVSKEAWLYIECGAGVNSSSLSSSKI